MRVFRIIRQVRQTTSLKRNGVSGILLQRKSVSKLFLRADYLLRFSAAYNPSKYLRTVLSLNRAECAIFGFFANFRGRRHWNEKRYGRYCFNTKKRRHRFFKRNTCYNSLLLTTHRNINELCQHVTERNARFSNLSPSLADDVVKTKKKFWRHCFNAKSYQNQFF